MGRRTWWQRVLSRLLGVFWLAFALLLSPLREVRFGFVDPINIGHFYYNFLDYRKMRKIDRNYRRSIRPLYLWEVFKPVSNNLALQLVMNQLGLRHSLLGIRSAHALASKCGAKRFLMTDVDMKILDKEDCFGMSDEFFTLPKTDRRLISEEWIYQLSKGHPVVCVHIRDGAYLASRGSLYGHEAREADFRNPPREAYIDVIEYLISAGYFVIKVGSVSERDFPIQDSMFFDYSRSGNRSEYLDIFVPWYCSAFIASVSGYSLIPALFGKPILFTNHFVGNLLCNYQPGVALISPFYSQVLRRNLTVQESAELNHGAALLGSELAAQQVHLVPNSSQEIVDATKLLLSNPESKPDEARSRIEKEFWKAYKKSIPNSLPLRLNFMESNLVSAFPQFQTT